MEEGSGSSSARWLIIGCVGLFFALVCGGALVGGGMMFMSAQLSQDFQDIEEELEALDE